MRTSSAIAAACATVACGMFSSATAQEAAGGYESRPVVREYVAELVATHGFSEDWLLDVLAGARRDETVIERFSRRAEDTLTWTAYRGIFLTDKRIADGVEFWQQHRDIFEAAEQKYGVAAEMLVAILGVETFYGRIAGNFRVLDTLATQAFDFPRRADFGRSQLTEFLLLVREEDADPFALNGSYAGAMGYGQFIPSSFRSFAVDFDEDGRRDIWNNTADAIGSVANYFARHDWSGAAPTALLTEVPSEELAALANTGLELGRTVGELRELGLGGADHIDADAKAALFRMELADDGEEFWLGLHDFYVITRYNRSSMYALAVLQLSEAIRDRYLAASPTPAEAVRGSPADEAS